NSWTRNTMSCTAMPAHRTAGPLEPGPLEDGTVALHPAANDVMGDRDRWRTGETFGMLAQQHGGALILAEPAQADELVLVHGQVFGDRLGMGADHQRHRKRPGLRVEVLHAPAADAGLFQCLATHRVFDRFAGFDETSETRPHCGGEAPGTA